MTIPVIINNRNLLTWTKAMVERIKRYENVGDIIIVDNGSTYEPLLEWYLTNPCDVMMKPNLGHTGAWLCGLVETINSDYVVTDPDLGLQDTPDDTLVVLQRMLNDNRGLGKVGLGLDWQSVTPFSPYYNHMQTYEKPRWINSTVIDGLFAGVGIDTTFALYPKDIRHHFTGGASMRAPYIAKHYPWYYTPEERVKDDEFSYYLRHSNGSCSYTRIGGGGVFKISDQRELNTECYNTDKFGMPKTFNKHHYEGLYDELLYDKRNKYMDVLEIGTWEGGSVRLLHDYLNSANIYGIDTNLLWSDTTAYPRLKLFSFDAYNIPSWSLLPKEKYDIIIDDGPHSHESQTFALNHFPQFLNEGGILIVEDVPKYNLQRILDTFTGDRDRLKIHDWSWITGRYDDIIITYV